MGKKKFKNGPRPILPKKQTAELATPAGSNNKSITVRSNVDASGNRVLTTRRVGKCAPLQAPPVKATNPDAVNSTPASPGTPELPAPRVRELAGDLLQPLGLGGFPVGSFEGFQASLPGFQAKMTGELLEELQEQAREVREVAFVKKHVWVYAIDHPTYGRLVVKEHPFKRDFNGSQMKCEKRAAKDMPVSARYAPILVCASTDQGFVGLTREAGVTASDLEDGLWWRPLEPAVKEQLGGLWEGIDSEVSWQQELVDKSLRMAATGLLSMADMRKLGIMFRDYKGDNILWDPIHKVWVLIDYGITQLRDFAKEPFKGGYTPGYVDPRAFLQRDSEGELLIDCMTSMWRICDWSSEIAMFFLGVLKLLNGRLPGPYQPYNQALSSDDPADIRAANARMAQELPEWLASLPSLQDEMFDFIRDDYPQLCSFIARAFSANVDERPTLADWLQLPELRSTLRSVLQREEAAQRAVEQQTAAIRALGDRIAADSSAEAGLLRWQQQQQEKEWLCNLEEGMRAEGPKEALFRENAVRKEGQKQIAPLQREKQYLQQQLEWQHLLLPGDMQQQLHQQRLQQYEAEQQQRRREWKAAKQPLWNQRLFLQQEPKSPVEAKYRELQLKQQNESAVLKLQQEIKQLQRQEQMQRQQAFEMLLQLRPAILPAAEGPMEALYREQLLIDESKVLMELLEQKQQHLQQQQLLPNYQQHAAQHQQQAKQQQQQQQQEEEEEVLSEQQQLWRERLQERHEPESPEEAADRQRWLQDHIRRVLQRMQRDSKQMQRQLLRQQWAQKRAAEVLEGALLREAAILEEMGAHIQPLQQKQLLLQQQLQYLQQYQHQQPHQQEPMQQQQEEEEGEAGKQQQMWQQRLQEREAPQSTEEAVYRQQWLQCNLHQALQQVQHENEQLQQHVRRLKQLAYQNHPYWVLAAAATAAAAAAATATAA